MLMIFKIVKKNRWNNHNFGAHFLKLMFQNPIDINFQRTWSKIRTRDPRTLRPRTPGPSDPWTLRPGTLGPWDPGPWDPETWDCGKGLWDTGTRDPDTQNPGNGSLGLGNCDPETQNPESRTLRIELVTQIPSIPNRTTDWINFNSQANFDNKKLDGPKNLPKYFDIWHNTKKLENI